MSMKSLQSLSMSVYLSRLRYGLSHNQAKWRVTVGYGEDVQLRWN